LGSADVRRPKRRKVRDARPIWRSNANPAAAVRSFNVRTEMKSGSTTISPTTSRPPGFRTRCSSRNAACSSGTSPSTLIRYAASKLRSGYGSRRASPTTSLTLLRDACAARRLRSSSGRQGGTDRQRVNADAGTDLEEAIAWLRLEDRLQAIGRLGRAGTEQHPTDPVWHRRRRAMTPHARRDPGTDRHDQARHRPPQLGEHGERHSGRAGRHRAQEVPHLRRHAMALARCHAEVSTAEGTAPARARSFLGSSTANGNSRALARVSLTLERRRGPWIRHSASRPMSSRHRPAAADVTAVAL
jgi:hypothetical protein